jgi:hypothetical protein
MGWADHAIGVANGSLGLPEVGKEVVTEFWRCKSCMGSAPVSLLFDQGLIDTKTADAWADEVWCQPFKALKYL